MFPRPEIFVSLSLDCTKNPEESDYTDLLVIKENVAPSHVQYLGNQLSKARVRARIQKNNIYIYIYIW